MTRPWFGLFLPQLRMDFDVILARTLAAEAAGFDSVWLMDHLAAPAAPAQDTLEGWTLAAALAVRTTTIRIGHLVTCDPFRHPAVLAKMAATVDVLSAGRLELGLGWGSVPDELATFGIGGGDAAERAARLAESIAVLDLMFAGDRFDFRGEHVTLTGAIGRPVPVQSPRPPLHIGGAGPRRTMPLVRAHADWWNCPCYAVDRFAELRMLAGGVRASVQRPVALAASPGRVPRWSRSANAGSAAGVGSWPARPTRWPRCSWPTSPPAPRASCSSSPTSAARRRSSTSCGPSRPWSRGPDPLPGRRSRARREHSGPSAVGVAARSGDDALAAAPVAVNCASLVPRSPFLGDRRTTVPNPTAAGTSKERSRTCGACRTSDAGPSG